MARHTSSAVFKPLISISAIAATVVGAYHFAPAAPSISSAVRTVTVVGPLGLARSVDGTNWTSSNSGPITETAFQISGDAGTEVGSYAGVLGFAYANSTDWLAANSNIADALTLPAVAHCSDFNSSDTYDVEMPEIVVGHDQFQSSTAAAIYAANFLPDDSCPTNCGVHDYLQPILKPTTPGFPGVFQFQEYFRWKSERKGYYSRVWSQTNKQWMSIYGYMEKLVNTQAAAANVTLPPCFWTCCDHPNYRDAIQDGHLQIVVQVVSLQGPNIDPSQFTSEGGDLASDLQGPPGLIFTPSSSHYRTSNAIYFDLGGTVGPPTHIYSEEIHPPANQPILTGQRGGVVYLDLAPVVDGCTITAERSGFPPLVMSLVHGPLEAQAMFTLPQSMPPGAYSLTKTATAGVGSHIFQGTNVIKLIVN